MGRSTLNLEELRTEIIDLLVTAQEPNGEFKTYARTTEGGNFYIGQSPFLTAHMAYLLSETNMPEVASIVDKAVQFLKGLDTNGSGLYKYWYPGNTNQTDYPLLAYDMDDTAVVNTVFQLKNQPIIKPYIINQNKNTEGDYYTWLQPGIKLLLRNPSLFPIYLEYVKLYRLFKKNADGLSMANFNDAEIMVQMNVDIFNSVTGKKVNYNERQLPFKAQDVREALSTSLHYDNIAMYYITLAKLHKHANILNTTQLIAFESAVRELIPEEKPANKLALYLSIAYIRKLRQSDVNELEHLLTNKEWKHSAFDICVGNKRYDSPHIYWSEDLVKCFILNLIDCLKTVE